MIHVSINPVNVSGDAPVITKDKLTQACNSMTDNSVSLTVERSQVSTIRSAIHCLVHRQIML